MIQNWIVHNLQIIGEAVRSLSGDFRERHQDISWKGLVGMRNVLVHRYFEIDTDLVWVVVNDELPILKQRIKAILGEIE